MKDNIKIEFLHGGRIVTKGGPVGKDFLDTFDPFRVLTIKSVRVGPLPKIFPHTLEVAFTDYEGIDGHGTKGWFLELKPYNN